MKNHVLKRTLAGVLAFLCVAVYVPANVGTGGLSGGTGIVANAAIDKPMYEIAMDPETLWSETGQGAGTISYPDWRVTIHADQPSDGTKLYISIYWNGVSVYEKEQVQGDGFDYTIPDGASISCQKETTDGWMAFPHYKIYLTNPKANQNPSISATNKVYDGTVASCSTSGGYGKCTVKFTGINGTSYDSSSAPSAAGSYRFTVSYAGNEEYNSWTDYRDFTISKAESIITGKPSAKELTYDGSAQQLVSAGSASGGTMQYSLDGTNYSTNIPTATDAGNYVVYYKVGGDSNHNDTAAQSVGVTIAHRIIAEVGKDATCTEDGYEAYWTDETGQKYSDAEGKNPIGVPVEISATGHDWNINDDMWVWDFDATPPTASVHLVCKNDETHTQYILAEVTLSEDDSSKPTCTEDGENHYIATVTIDGKEYTSEFTEELNATGHNYEPFWDWAEDYSSATLTLTCQNDDSHVENVDAVVTSVETPATYDGDGNIVYTATAEFDGKTYTDTQNVPIPQLERTSIANAAVSLKKSSLVYDGTEQTAEVTSVKVDGVTLTKDVDYEVTGNTATEAGTYTLTITGKGAYEGTVEKTYKVVKQYTITYTIDGKATTKTYNDKTFCKVTAPEIDGKTFAYWEISENGAKVSTNASYTFRVVSDTSLEAVYVDNAEEIVAEPAIAVTSVTTSGTKICYEVTRDVPEDYTVVSTGVLYGTSTALFADADSSTRDNNLRFTNDEGSTDTKSKVYKGVSSFTTNQGYYSYSLNVGTAVDRVIYLRGYVIVKDSDGNSKTYYADIVDKSYNQAKS